MSDSGSGNAGGGAWRNDPAFQPHAFDPQAQPELFRGVLTRRVFAFLIDVVVLTVPVVLGYLFIAVFGIITLGLGWMLFWLAVVWFLPNTQQLLARWHPAYNYGIAERERDLPLVERIRIPASWPMARWRMEWRPNAIGAAFIGILVALACLNLSHVSEFLYFRY